ncbi:MAG TPA: helix-turn-helix domain-containing protein [Acidimicrobiales bacterium]|nr:helix-turn-helix domain-containing protein [Acidimicrobiales bacterium]
MDIGATGHKSGAVPILEALGLSEKEARVLVVLVIEGSASAARLAAEADLYRTNVYPVLESLETKGLVGRLPGKASVWSSAGRDRVVERLYTTEERRHETLQVRKADLIRALTAPQKATVAPPPRLELVHGPTDTARIYDEMLRSARREVLVLNRPPYGMSFEDPSGVILEMLQRGVSTRVIYRSIETDDEAFRQECEVYVAAGAEARVTDELPTKLVVVDRQTVLVAVMTSDEPEEGFPDSQYLDHPGLAAPWAALFERYWATSTPMADVNGPTGAASRATSDA